MARDCKQSQKETYVPRVAALSATCRSSEEAIDGTGKLIQDVSGCCTKMEDQLGELDASKNGWTAKPPHLRDRNKAQLHYGVIGIWSGAIRKVLV